MRMKILIVAVMMYPYFANAQNPCYGGIYELFGRLGLSDCKTAAQVEADRRKEVEWQRYCQTKPGDCTLKDACPDNTIFGATANQVREDRECVERWRAIAAGRSR